MIKKCQSIILSTKKYGDSSKISKTFTRELGIISVIAKGAMKPKSKFGASIEPMNLVETVFYHKQNRDIQTLSEANVLEYYSKLITSIESAACGYMIVEAISITQHENQENPELFDIAIESLHLLNNSEVKSELILLDFLFKLIDNIGYTLPHPTEDNADLFSISNSKFVDSKNDSYTFQFGINTFSLLKSLLANEELSKIEYKEKAFRRLFKFLRTYLSYHMDRQFNLKSASLLNL